MKLILVCTKCGKEFGSIEISTESAAIQAYCLGCTEHEECLHCGKQFEAPQDSAYCEDCCEDPMG